MQMCNKFTITHTCNKPNNSPIQLIKQGVSAHRLWAAVHESLPPRVLHSFMTWRRSKETALLSNLICSIIMLTHTHGQLTISSTSARAQLNLISQPAKRRLTVSWTSAHEQFTVSSTSACAQLNVISQSAHIRLTVTWTSAHGRLSVSSISEATFFVCV